MLSDGFDDADEERITINGRELDKPTAQQILQATFLRAWKNNPDGLLTIDFEVVGDSGEDMGDGLRQEIRRIGGVVLPVMTETGEESTTFRICFAVPDEAALN